MALRVLSIALLVGAVLLTGFAVFVMTLWSDLGWEPPLGSIVLLFLLCSAAPVLGAIAAGRPPTADSVEARARSDRRLARSSCAMGHEQLVAQRGSLVVWESDRP